jgi:hypothetical protein
MYGCLNVSNSGDTGWLMYIEVERIWQEVSVAKFEAWGCPGGSEENRKFDRYSRSLSRDMNRGLQIKKQDCQPTELFRLLLSDAAGVTKASSSSSHSD